jgi:hypothetical protein
MFNSSGGAVCSLSSRRIGVSSAVGAACELKGRSSGAIKIQIEVLSIGRMGTKAYAESGFRKKRFGKLPESDTNQGGRVFQLRW